MKIDFIADTNFLIYVHEGKEVVSTFLAYDFGVSFISEVELLGFTDITKAQEIKLTQLLNDCLCLYWNDRIKQQTIELKRKYSIKLPDAIIASTAIIYETPLVTADKGFSKITEIDLVLIEI